MGVGVLALLVIDTGDNGFGTVGAGDFQIAATPGDDDFIGDGDDLVVAMLDSTSFPSAGIKAGSISINLDDAVVSTGNTFIMYWFPQLSIANGDTGAIVGNEYGKARPADWLVGAGGTTPR